MMTVYLDDQPLRAWISQVQAAGKSRPFLMVLGREARNQLRSHYLGLHRSKPNRLGGQRTGFWRQVAQSVQSPQLQGASSVAVAIAHPAIRQKVQGGTIVPKHKKALTIPVSKEAYGRTAETLEHELGVKLFRVPSDFGEGLLASAVKGGGIKVHYVLRTRVTQAPDPDAMPAPSALLAALLSRARAWWTRMSQTP